MQINNSNSSIKIKDEKVSVRVVGGSYIKGDKGEQGIQGPEGKQGIPGPEGKQGLPGRDGIDGKDGTDGRGIKTITLIDTKDKVKTYRIEYTDGTSFDFQVKDGEDGKDGKEGMSGGAVLRGAEKTSRKTNEYNTQSKETYPSSKALYDAIHSLKTIQFKVVEELPTVGQPNIVYLIQEEEDQRGGSGGDIYSEWVCVENEITHTLSWEKLGTDVDLSDYVKYTDIVSSVDSSSTNGQAVGAKLFYDTCGDIEAAINLIRGV